MLRNLEDKQLTPAPTETAEIRAERERALLKAINAADGNETKVKKLRAELANLRTPRFLRGAPHLQPHLHECRLLDARGKGDPVLLYDPSKPRSPFPR
jgi:hypothetical protein